MNVNRIATRMLIVGAAMLAPGCATYDDFRLTTTNGAQVALGEQKGKAVLVAFWAAG